jgi:MoaA/NifB/PqqE/SkfB family radical SAM enzyme
MTNSPSFTPLPTFLQIEPVGQCNLRCTMCSIQFREDGPPHGPPAFLEWETFVRVLEELPDLEELQLQGLGEPLMHPRFFDMVRYATDRGIRVSTNSNLTLMTAARAERCVQSGLEWLHVSLDGAHAETYERIRVRSHFDRVLTNMRGLLSARERAGSSLPHLRLVMVIMRQNLDELPAVVRIAHEMSFEAMFVQHLCHEYQESTLPERYKPMRQFVDEQTLLHEDPRRVARAFGEARAVAHDLGVDLRLPNVEQHPQSPPVKPPRRCDWPWRGAYLSYQGLAMPCCMVSTPDRINFGSTMDQGFVATWQSQPYQRFREQLASDEPPTICRSCSLYSGAF